MAEASGAQALSELILDRELDLALRSRGLTPAPADFERERALCLENIGAIGGLSADEAALATEEVRRRRGLGPQRFQSLIERSAKLRMLVHDEVSVNPADLAAALAMEFGNRATARVITVRTRAEAGEIHARLATLAGNQLDVAFAEEAMRHSTDPAAPRGGLLVDASPADVAFGGAVREALRDQPEGVLGPVLGVEQGFAIVYVRSRTPGKGNPTPDDRARVEARLRLRAERLAMQRRADEILAGADVAVLDPSLKWGWDNRAR